MERILLGGIVLNFLMLLVLLYKNSQNGAAEKIAQLEVALREQKTENMRQQEQLRIELSSNLQSSLGAFGTMIANNLQNSHEMTNAFLKELGEHQQQQLITSTDQMQKQLDEMRLMVDERLQKSLNERMTESFKLVNDRLEQVYKGLGEMQSLAKGVGELQRVMSNVKTRGILGEIQLGAILEEILSKEQYAVNVATKRGSRDVVEYAVKLPTEDGSVLFLPIDAKFPGETFGQLRDACDSGERERIKACSKALINTLKSEARAIHDKYIDVPQTTDFAIMFLPFEGLYAEAVNNGLVEVLQREYHVNIAGPSTMAALLNSIQMSFKTFAIQKRSGEVWQVLGAVKTEFDKFASTLAATQTKLNQANDELDTLIGTRTRKMQLRLQSVTELSEGESGRILQIYTPEPSKTGIKPSSAESPSCTKPSSMPEAKR